VTSKREEDCHHIDVSMTPVALGVQSGSSMNDQILMARALVLHAARENTKIEEQLGEGVGLALHATERGN
jgi:hypothetical protein